MAFDILQGIGIAAAVGIRPFLPALLVGALAAGSVEIHFNGTDFSFLQSAPFLVGMGVGALGLLLAERALRSSARSPAPATVIIAVCGLALGALLFAGSLARGHYAAWPGILGGVICAGVAAAASVPLLARVGARLGGQDASALPVYVEALAVLVAGLSVLAPPVGLIAFLLVGWLLFAGRRREGEKYAGLRILR